VRKIQLQRAAPRIRKGMPKPSKKRGPELPAVGIFDELVSQSPVNDGAFDDDRLPRNIR
jgi:hypothetical protein